MESIHWGLGSGLGAFFGGVAYGMVGAVRLFEASAVMSFLSMLLAVFACIRYSTPHSTSSDSSIEFTALPSAQHCNDDTDIDTDIDYVEEGRDKELSEDTFNPFIGTVEKKVPVSNSSIAVMTGTDLRVKSSAGAYTPLNSYSDKSVD